MPKGELLRSGRESARLTTWSGTSRRVVLAPVARHESPVTAEFVRWCCDALRDRGVSEVYSPALTSREAEPFFTAGFEQFDSLWLLVRPLGRGAPRIGRPASRAQTRRAKRHHLQAIETLDSQSFNQFWALDQQGILDARAATASGRFMVALAPDPVGYAITGWGSGQAYLQRLAVTPAARRQGIARDLVIDALRSSRRRLSAQMLVNTQVGNDAALALYESLGFVLQEGKLGVLRRSLDLGQTRPPERAQSMGLASL